MALRRLGSRLATQLHRQGASAVEGPCSALQHVLRLSTGPGDKPDAAEVAKALRTNDFLEMGLAELRAERSAISHAELLAYMQQRYGSGRQRIRQLQGRPCDAAHAGTVPPLVLVLCRGFTPGAATDVIERLERSGAVLNFLGTVLLRPGEVAEALSLVRGRLTSRPPSTSG